MPDPSAHASFYEDRRFEDEPPAAPTRGEQEAEAWEYWHQWATALEGKAKDMRNAIDMIEGAMMGLGDFVELPNLFDGATDDVVIAPRMTVGQMRRVCAALSECTRVINSDEYVIRRPK